MFNQVSLLGNVARVLVDRHFESGAHVIKFVLAVDEYRSGEHKTHYIVCHAWGKLAGVISEYAPIGKQLAIAGSLNSETWGEPGEVQTRMFVKVDNVQLLASPKDKE